MKYVMKPRNGARINIVEIKRVEHPWKLKKSREAIETPFGPMRISENSNIRDRANFLIHTDIGRIFLPATRAGIKECLRVLRDSEAAILEDIDAKIRVLEEYKKEVLHAAWERGNTVQVQDIESMTQEKTT